MNATQLTPPPQRIGPWSNGITLAPDEFDAIDDWKAGYRYELVRGVLVVSPMPAKGERSPNELLGYFLLTYKFTNPQGTALADTISEETLPLGQNRRRPDRVIWLTTVVPRDLDECLPEIVIEFVSKRNRDRRRDYVLKREEYATAGVLEYWGIDRFRRTLTVYRGLTAEQVIHPGETYTTPLLAGFELPLDPLLAAADKWNRPRKEDCK